MKNNYFMIYYYLYANKMTFFKTHFSFLIDALIIVSTICTIVSMLIGVNMLLTQQTMDDIQMIIEKFIISISLVCILGGTFVGIMASIYQ